MSTRNSRMIDMSDEAARAFRHACELEGMSQKELASRMFEWLARLDRESRQVVLGTIPLKYAPDAAQSLAEQCVKLVKEREENGTLEQATPEGEKKRVTKRKKSRGRGG